MPEKWHDLIVEGNWARKLKPKNIDTIEAVFDDEKTGLTIGEVHSRLSVEIPRRTLARRLDYLVGQDRLSRTGRGRATRYARTIHGAVQQEITRDAKSNLLNGLDESDSSRAFWEAVSLSEGSFEIARVIRQHMSLREPVSYRREFLDRYAPNTSYYLPEKTRRHLLEIGRSDEQKSAAGTYGRQILDRLLIDLTFHSSRLEGNTYSLLETKRLIEWGRAADGHGAEETQMVLNHKAAIEFLVEVADEGAGIDRRLLLNLHALLSDNLLGDPSQEGRLRTGPVSIGGSTYVPNAVPQTIEECFSQVALVATQIRDPFEQSFFLLVHLPYLQPFNDVNKRVSRLAANIPLVRENLRPLSFIDVPKDAYTSAVLGVYELNRIELLRDVFVWAYERSAEQYKTIRHSLGSPDEFRLRYRNEIKEIVGEIIRRTIPLTDVIEFVRTWGQDRLPDSDQLRFIAVIEAELIGLHEGNYARYRVTPKQFDEWVRLS